MLVLDGAYLVGTESPVFLARYVSRPPVSVERLSLTVQGQYPHP